MAARHLQQAQGDPTTSGLAKQPLSCANCRHRKIKCDKTQPRCTQCERSDLDCVFPSRKRNRKPRQGRQSELLNRISRLESIVSKVDSGNVDATTPAGREHEGEGGGPIKGPGQAAALAATAQIVAGRTRSASAAPQSESEPKHTTPVAGWDHPAPPTNYLSAEFWENLCQEVEGMRQALDQPSDDDESSEDDPSMTSPESSAPKGVTPPALSGLISCGGAFSSELKHPSREHILYMCNIFFLNVDPVFKLLHRPTTSAELGAFANSPTKRTDAATEALFFSMYYGAVTGLTNEECLQSLGDERGVLAQRYREGVERALYKADYLNSTEIKALQALTFYVCFLRSHNASRASWALIPLLVRLAQSLHLHRDGVSPAISPFEAEMRRRLWWMIVVLDIRAAEDRGTDAAIPRQSYNTRLPYNLDDDDFGPSTTTPLEDKLGPTEMTFCLCTSMSSGIFGNLRPRHPQLALEDDNGSGAEHATSEDEIMAHAQRLEALFGTAPKDTDEPVDARNLAAGNAAVTVRIIILKMWLSAQYPFTPRGPAAAAKPRVARETMLRTAVNTIELVEYSSTHYRQRFGWWIDSYVQWHPLAVALAELCVQTRGELADRAWQVVDRNFSEMGARIADTRRGTLWRPLKKLLRKAKAARAEALMGDLRIREAVKAGGVKAEVKTPGRGARDQQVEEGGDDVQVESEDGRDAEGEVEVSAGGMEQLPLPTAMPPMTIGLDGGVGGGMAMAVDASANAPVLMAEDLQMFGGQPLWGHPQDLINHFGVQLDASDFSWDWSTWNEFVDDANTERSPGDD
ncbi:Bikaverin cluster transcription factor bik5 [Colletotrichum trifolii]|uniref:Bikaverin cluster transcription factor bik5 n=1 Tax=Colletotrichum trifolii TaxID=5466 RepID=A0A4R8RSA7_COLTR|nr:Bikaverin cluster transcription factor bik5 [Colletotrichum trifolii]